MKVYGQNFCPACDEHALHCICLTQKPFPILPAGLCSVHGSGDEWCFTVGNIESGHYLTYQAAQDAMRAFILSRQPAVIVPTPNISASVTKWGWVSMYGIAVILLTIIAFNW